MSALRSNHYSADSVSQAPWQPITALMKLAVAQLIAWQAVCSAYYGAAATYQELARLSDAELRRRGLSRDTLARDVCETLDRSKPEDPRTMLFW